MRKRHIFCGIDCVFSKQKDALKLLLFENIDFGNYYFFVADAGFFAPLQGIDDAETFSPNFFRELVRRPMWTESFVLHLYAENVSSEKIDTYDDYVKSQCEMIVLLCDTSYVEIYCKNQVWLQELLRSARAIPNATVEEKYEDTDPRYRMYV